MISEKSLSLQDRSGEGERQVQIFFAPFAPLVSHIIIVTNEREAALPLLQQSKMDSGSVPGMTKEVD